MPNWLVVVQAVIAILQQTGLLQVLIDIINKLIAAIAGGATPSAAIIKSVPDLIRLYAKLPADKQEAVLTAISKGFPEYF